ncbi:MAG: helix-turn-helix transcriptional regulator [Gammaproteobacteria bacterium]|nr:helix-turn-helix transcriptional regulator [Gammaproteobacteria bacterium]
MRTIKLLKPLTEQHISFQTESEAREFYKPFGDKVNINDFFNITINHKTNLINFITMIPACNKAVFDSMISINEEEIKPGIRYLAASNFSTARYEINKAFDMCNVLEFTERHGDVTSIFGFGTSRNDSEVINEYFANLHLFQRFIHNFENDAKDLIRKTNAAPTPLLITNFNMTEKNSIIVQSKNGHEIRLSQREIEVLRLLSHGSSAKSSAIKLGLSPRTIESYVSSLKNKLQLHRKADLIAFYHKENGLYF